MIQPIKLTVCIACLLSVGVGVHVPAGAWEPNRHNAVRIQENAGDERERTLVDRACAVLPTFDALVAEAHGDRDAASARYQQLDSARMDRRQALLELGEQGMEAIPRLCDVARCPDGNRRRQALLVLLFLKGNWVTINTDSRGDRKDEIIAATAEVLRRLQKADESDSEVRRSDEEKALLALGVYGAEISPVHLFHPERDYEVLIPGGWSGGDDGLVWLTRLGKVRSLQIASPQISSQGLSFVKLLPDLTTLRLWVSDFDASSLDQLKGLPSLAELSIDNEGTDELLQGLAGLDSITSLSIHGISDAGLQSVARLRGLKSLWIFTSPKFVGTGLQYLNQFAQLESLWIHDARAFTGDGLQHLSGHAGLRMLSLSNTRALGASMAGLAQLPALRELQLSYVPLSAAGVEHIGKAKQLQRLTITNSTLVDDDLRFLADLPRVSSLELSRNAISDAGIRHLEKLPSLVNVELEGTFVTRDAKKKLRAFLQANAKALGSEHGESEIIDLLPMDVEVFEAGEFGLLLDPHGRYERTPVSAEYLAIVRDIVGSGAGVWPGEDGCGIWLFSHWSGGDDGIGLLETLGDVAYVTSEAPLTDAAIPHLKKLVHLRRIELAGTRMTDAGIEELQRAVPGVRVVRRGGR